VNPRTRDHLNPDRWLRGRSERGGIPYADPCDDRGSVAVLMCFIVIIGGILVTFLIDAGSNIQAANRADTYSTEAARAASIAIGPVPGPDATLQAAAAARSYLTQAGATGTVIVTGPATVQVTVTVTEQTPILRVTVHQTRTHTAQLQVGVTNGQGVS
jgi:Flp pilus assembly protein TadG